MKTLSGLTIVCAFVTLMLMACDYDDYIDLEDEKIVVDGWINSDEAPVVILTKNLPIALHNYHVDDLTDRIVMDADVRVVCDGDTVSLEAEYNESFFPPVVFTTQEMKGIPGKTYTLLVDLPDGNHLDAVTTVPAPVPLDSLTVRKSDNNRTKYVVTGHFKDDPSQKNYYKYFVKVDKPDGAPSEFGDGLFLTPPFSGLFDDAILGAYTRFPIRRGTVSFNSETEIDFKEGDIVTVRFAQLDATSYKFWNEYQDVQSFAGTMSMTFSREISSNVSGGLGAWCGYGVTYYAIEVK